MIRRVAFAAVAGLLFAVLIATSPAGTALPQWAQVPAALAVSVFGAWALTGLSPRPREGTGHGRDDA